MEVRVAVRKAVGKVAKKLVGRRSTNDESPSEPLPRIVPSGPGDRFEGLPWRFTGTKPEGTSKQIGHFMLLLVAHSACRTGAPLCLLQLAQELSRIADFEFILGP
jgi:hypothetical protein